VIAPQDIRKKYVLEIVKSERMSELMKNKYGNYVILKLLSTSDIEGKQLMMQNIAKHLNLVNVAKYRSRWAQFIDENPMKVPGMTGMQTTKPSLFKNSSQNEGGNDGKKGDDKCESTCKTESCTGKPTSAPAEKAPAAKADDFDDMFGDEEVDENGETAAERAANKARGERMALAKKLKEEKDAKEGKTKKDKEKPVEKSLIVLEVKPWEADTDLEMVWREIIKYQQEGLSWGQNFKLEPVAYGIKKLVMTVTIVDSLVLLDDITDNIEALENHVQSVYVASMNKI